MGIDENDLKKRIVKQFVPAIIADLLRNDEITENSSKIEVISAVRKYLKNEERFNSINVAIVIGDEFIDAIKNEIEHGHLNVAIALSGIQIEHMLNEFYQQILINKQHFSIREYNSCMKSISVRDKLTWLYRLVTDDSIDNELVAKLVKICSQRNSLVHYKPKIASMGDWGEPIKDNAKEFDIGEILEELKELEEILQNVISLQFEIDSVAHQMYNNYFCD